MPPKKAVHEVSHSGTPSPARSVTPVDAEAAGFSPEGDDILGRLQALTEGAAPSVFAGPARASGEDDDDAGSSVSGTTAVAAGLPADIGARVQKRVRDIEYEISRFFSDSTNKVPVPARNFVMSRLFELVAFCGDLRAEAASEKGAAMALQGPTRRDAPGDGRAAGEEPGRDPRSPCCARLPGPGLRGSGGLSRGAGGPARGLGRPALVRCGTGWCRSLSSFLGSLGDRAGHGRLPGSGASPRP
ncbi:hypothetical protein MTO96_042137 [Rhipicephalus appendiculatus]